MDFSHLDEDLWHVLFTRGGDYDNILLVSARGRSAQVGLSVVEHGVCLLQRPESWILSLHVERAHIIKSPGAKGKKN